MTMRCQIVAELATSHGGDIAVAEDMIRAAADAGADLVKLQTYSLERLNPRDPQAAWLRQSHLDEGRHAHLLGVAQRAGIELFSTPFDADSLAMLRRLGLKRFKVASSESGNDWWMPQNGEHWIVSYPWGNTLGCPDHLTSTDFLQLTAIPLYPTPLECVDRARLLDGWSDHCEGIAACLWAIAQGAQMIEVHFWHGESRHLSFDKSTEQVRQIRRFAEDCETMKSGVSQRFRDRWRVSA